MTKSKTGKHGSAKCHLKCTDVFSGKNLFALLGSQDKVEVVRPDVSQEYMLTEVPDREGTALFQRGEEELELTPTKEQLAALAEALERDEDPLCSILEWKGRHVLLRVAKRKN